MDPFWIGVLGTIMAAIMFVGAVRMLLQQRGNSTIAKLYALMALLFVGMIWFIILQLIPAG